MKQSINHIAFSIFARAHACVKKETILPAVVISAALFFSACVAPKQQLAKSTLSPKAELVTFTDLGEKISSIQVKRLNESNGASETLTVKGSDAVIMRSNGFRKSLNIGDKPFATISENIFSLKAAPAGGPVHTNGVRIYFTIAGTNGVKEFEMDPAQKMMPVYADLMNIRDQVLVDGK